MGRLHGKRHRCWSEWAHAEIRVAPSRRQCPLRKIIDAGLSRGCHPCRRSTSEVKADGFASSPAVATTFPFSDVLPLLLTTVVLVVDFPMNVVFPGPFLGDALNQILQTAKRDAAGPAQREKDLGLKVEAGQKGGQGPQGAFVPAFDGRSAVARPSQQEHLSPGGLSDCQTIKTAKNEKNGSEKVKANARGLLIAVSQSAGCFSGFRRTKISTSIRNLSKRKRARLKRISLPLRSKSSSGTCFSYELLIGGN